MKAIKFAEPWKVDCVDQAMPEPKEGEALIKIHCAAVCGSDIGAFRAPTVWSAIPASSAMRSWVTL